MPEGKLLIFDTHPIQYRSPVFRALYRKFHDLDVRFFNEVFDGSRWWFHEVGKIPKQKWELPLREGFPNEVLDTARLGPRGTWREIGKLLRAERPAAVVVYGYYLPEHWMLRVLCARYRLPIVFIGETFSQGSSSLRRLVKVPLQRYFFRGVSQFIAIGNRTEQFYRSVGIEAARITPAKYCTDVGFFQVADDRASAARESFRKRHGIPADAFVLLFVGRLFERKRPWDMLALHDRLKESPAVHTVIVGNGHLDESLKARAAGDPRVVFTGFQNQAETRDCYYGADLLVVPSEYETWGLVVNEAFACGLPALVTDTCGTAEDLVVPGETGFVYPVGATDEAAARVKELLRDTALRARMGKAARKKVASEYSIDQFADAFLEAMKRITATEASS